MLACYAEWKQGRASEFNAAAAPSKEEQRQIHKAAMKEASLLLAERRSAHKGTKLGHGEGAASIIGEMKVKYPGWVGCSPFGLEKKAKKSPGESPQKNKNQGKRYFTDELEEKICTACLDADESNQQFSLPLLCQWVQGKIEGTEQAAVFKNAKVTKQWRSRAAHHSVHRIHHLLHRLSPFLLPRWPLVQTG